MKQIYYLFAWLLLAIPFSSYAEIQEISLRWNPTMCNDNCRQLLKTALLKIPAVQDVRLDGPAGRSDIVWKPNYPYNYQTLNYPMRAIGIIIFNMQMKAKGKVTHSGDEFFVISSGDNTKIQLLSQLKLAPSSTLYVEKNSIYAYTVDEGLKAKLLDAEKNNLTVYVEGQIFEPWRYMSPVLILSNFKVLKPEEK